MSADRRWTLEFVGTPSRDPYANNARVIGPPVICSGVPDPDEPIEVVPADRDDTQWCPACVDLAAQRDVLAKLADHLGAQRDTAWDALREIEAILRKEDSDDYTISAIAATLANGPLDTAPGGPREDECARLITERDGLRAEVTELRNAMRQIANTYAAPEAVVRFAEAFTTKPEHGDHQEKP